MQDIRCGKCSKKLGAGEYTRLEIKCPRCGALNTFSDLMAMSHIAKQKINEVLTRAKEKSFEVKS